MTIIKEIHQINTTFEIIGCVLLALGALCIIAAIWTASSFGDYDTFQIVLASIGVVLVVLSILSAVFAKPLGQTDVQYQAIVTNVDEVEAQGYTIVGHKDADVYLLEKTVTP